MIVAGDAFDGILQAAGACSASLIVMGAHRKQLLRYIFVGTTIERVIRTGSYPVLMVNTEAAHPYARLIPATDTRRSLRRTPSGAGARADRRRQPRSGPRLQRHGQGNRIRGGWGQVDAFVAEERARADGELMAFLQAHGLADNGWLRRITEGSAIAAITEAVQVIAPDLVVIGTRGRSVLTTALLGSVTQEVLRSLNVDILAVPPPR